MVRKTLEALESRFMSKLQGRYNNNNKKQFVSRQNKKLGNRRKIRKIGKLETKEAKKNKNEGR